MKFRIVLNKSGIIATLSIIMLTVITLYPVSSTLTKSAFLGLLILNAAGPYFIKTKWKKFKIIHSSVIALVVLFFLIRPFTTSRTVPEIYLQNLKSYEGIRYIWGGENFLGIDCSGLPRKSLISALITKGQYLKGLEIWWYDCSAKAMSEGYRNYTIKVCSFNSLRKAEYNLLKPGDLAVTASGIHVIVYLGNERWIQADPEQGSVVIEDPVTTSSSWFDTGVNIFRWQAIN